MSVRNQLKLLVGGLNRSRAARPAALAAMGEFLERSQAVAGLIFIVTVAAIVLISSAGLTTFDARLKSAIFFFMVETKILKTFSSAYRLS